MQNAGKGARVLLACADHSNLPSNPGWLLRNALLLAAVRLGPKRPSIPRLLFHFMRVDPTPLTQYISTRRQDITQCT